MSTMTDALGEKIAAEILKQPGKKISAVNR